MDGVPVACRFRRPGTRMSQMALLLACLLLIDLPSSAYNFPIGTPNPMARIARPKSDTDQPWNHAGNGDTGIDCM
ncbi:hypothetical protein J3F83DRAFT_113364 [Trichoderma novae-zelandiae]